MACVLDQMSYKAAVCTRDKKRVILLGGGLSWTLCGTNSRDIWFYEKNGQKSKSRIILPMRNRKKFSLLSRSKDKKTAETYHSLLALFETIARAMSDIWFGS